MSGDVQVRFCERLGVKFPRATHLVVVCRTAEDAQRALAIVQRWTAAAGLQLHPEKTRLVDVQQPGGFDFLGYHFTRRYRLPRTKSLRKLKDAVRQKTRRTHGHSFAVIIHDLNRVLRGWFEYFKHSRAHAFVPIDAWVRMRVRCILRHRMGRRGRSIRFDHHQWPRRFFTAQGLFSLTHAHAAARQSFVR